MTTSTQRLSSHTRFDKTTGRPYYMNEQQFEWDAAKSEINLAKHGVSFEGARGVFDDVFAVDS